MALDSLNLDGKLPCAIDRLATFEIIFEKTEEQDLSSDVDMKV